MLISRGLLIKTRFSGGILGGKIKIFWREKIANLDIKDFFFEPKFLALQTLNITI